MEQPDIGCVGLYERDAKQNLTSVTRPLPSPARSNGTVGYWLCRIIMSEALWIGALLGSFINLAVITIERYLKVVHHVWAKTNLRKWMKHALVLFTWISGYFVAWIWTITNTDVIVIHGACHTLMLMKSPAGRLAFVFWHFLTFYVGLFLLFLFCYGRILLTLRRQASVMASYNAPGGPSTAQTQAKKMQFKIIKTMILVSLLYIVLWTPGDLHSFLMNVSTSIKMNDAILYITNISGFLYNCANPFIYATNFDPVKNVLLRMIPWKRNVQPIESIQMT